MRRLAVDDASRRPAALPFLGKIEAAGRPLAFWGPASSGPAAEATEPLAAVGCPAGAEQAARQTRFVAKPISNPRPSQFPPHLDQVDSPPIFRQQSEPDSVTPTAGRSFQASNATFWHLHNYLFPECQPAIARRVHLTRRVTFFVHFKMDFLGSFNAMRHGNFPYFWVIFWHSGMASFGHDS